MHMKVILPGTTVRFDYVNHRGVSENRTVVFRGLDFGSNEYYPEPQFLLRGWCLDRKAVRSFAIGRIDGEELEIIA